MSFLSENLRYLRSQLNHSQQQVADDLLITRGRYAKYEDGASEPPIEILIKISRYYHVSIDLLVSVNLRKYPLKDLLELPDNRIVLPIAVDDEGENKIEIIPHKASMGYLSGYSDPEYIESLETLSLPFLSRGKYRAFPAEGDSMPPHKEGSYIIGKYLESARDLKNNRTYVFITRQEGIVYKRLTKLEEEKLELSSDNPYYGSFSVLISDVLEIWEYAGSIATSEFSREDFSPEYAHIRQLFEILQKEIQELKE